MNLAVVGISHKTAPVEIREKFSFSPNKIIEANRLLKECVFLSENLILSTCNRVEIYAAATSEADYIKGIKNFLSKFHNLNLLDYKKEIYAYKDNEAIEHLFKVASGLDSMVIGEMEILGQVKKAYQDAKQSRTTGKILHRLFEKAFNTAKKIRTETFVSRGAVSVSSAAVKLAEKILGRLNDRKVLIIGAGAVGEQLVLYLKKNGIKSIFVTNRTLEKARDLAVKFSALAVSLEDFKNSLVEIDIIISSTGAPHSIIRKDDILFLMPKRKQRPLFIIDLAVPRNVEPEANQVDNVYLYDIDDLRKIVNENITLRENELYSCSSIISTAADRFMASLVSEKIKNVLR